MSDRFPLSPLPRRVRVLAHASLPSGANGFMTWDIVEDAPPGQVGEMFCSISFPQVVEDHHEYDAYMASMKARASRVASLINWGLSSSRFISELTSLKK